MKKYFSVFILGGIIGAIAGFYFKETKVIERKQYVTDTAFVRVPEYVSKPVLLQGKYFGGKDKVSEKETLYVAVKDGVNAVGSSAEYQDSILTAKVAYYFEANQFEFGYVLKERKEKVITNTITIYESKEWYNRFGAFGGINLGGGFIVGAQYQVTDFIHLGIYTTIGGR